MKPGDFDGVRSDRRHPHRSAERNERYDKKEQAQRQHAQIRRRFRGRLDRSNGGAVGQGKTSKRGALMPPSMLRRNPNKRDYGIKVRYAASRSLCSAIIPLAWTWRASFDRRVAGRSWRRPLAGLSPGVRALGG